MLRPEHAEQHPAAIVWAMPQDLEVDHVLCIGVDWLVAEQQPGAREDLLDPPHRAALSKGNVPRGLARLVELYDGGRADAWRRRRVARGEEEEERELAEHGRRASVSGNASTTRAHALNLLFAV